MPCSGSGTWRRTPDAKWRLTPQGFADLLDQQAAILAQAAGLDAAGGRAGLHDLPCPAPREIARRSAAFSRKPPSPWSRSGVSCRPRTRMDSTWR
ncbi:hypothetical protein [Paracoccus mutanolyticus]|uniref:hypothetical protein n=1 Tax=Paracoccus mutanolyticus TaxID=1499308 RepID=UPI0029500098|nr:hypothetical protein [Paracoccus mutanolyticus]